MSKFIDIDKQYLQTARFLDDLQATQPAVDKICIENKVSTPCIEITHNETHLDITSEQMNSEAADIMDTQVVESECVKEHLDTFEMPHLDTEECLNSKANHLDITQNETVEEEKDIDTLLADGLYTLHTKVSKIIKKIFKSE